METCEGKETEKERDLAEEMERAKERQMDQYCLHQCFGPMNRCRCGGGGGGTGGAGAVVPCEPVLWNHVVFVALVVRLDHVDRSDPHSGHRRRTGSRHLLAILVMPL